MLDLFKEVRKDAIKERSIAKEKQDKENQEASMAQRRPPSATRQQKQINEYGISNDSKKIYEIYKNC